MNSLVNYFRFEDSYFNFTSLSEVTRYIEKQDCPLDYHDKLLFCYNDGLFFALRISVTILYKSDFDNFTVYSINYSISE